MLSEYELSDIYNGDETAYFSRMQPGCALTTHQLVVKKKDQARITVMVTSNGKGSERVPSQIIGSPKPQWCFNNVDIHLLGSQYQYINTT